MGYKSTEYGLFLVGVKRCLLLGYTSSLIWNNFPLLAIELFAQFPLMILTKVLTSFYFPTDLKACSGFFYIWRTILYFAISILFSTPDNWKAGWKLNQFISTQVFQRKPLYHL